MQLSTILKTTNTPVVIETSDGKHFQVTGDTSKHAGCMQFTSEWGIHLTIQENNSMEFSEGWEIASSEISYPTDGGSKLFEHRHPGILKDIHCFIKDNIDMFTNQTK